VIKANNPSLESWISITKNSDFPIQNLPFGIIKPHGKNTRVGSIIGDTVIDLQALAHHGFFNHLNFATHVFKSEYLNDFMALGKSVCKEVRNTLSDLFEKNNPVIRDNNELKAICLHPLNKIELLLPIKIGDYTDFYSSKEHATNVGSMFRDPSNALLPNWKHIPIGYHGRASSIIVSGTPFHRPNGQIKPNEAEIPFFAPTRLLDFELEIAFTTCKSTAFGKSISLEKTDEYIWGLMLFNDWSARDIQAWEYVPLGPFLAKSFASSVSPWIVTLDALEPFRTKGPEQDVKVLPYLEFSGNKNFDIQLEVFIQAQNLELFKVCTSNFKYMYWNMNQQLAHQTSNGCNINVGDLYASGTISGPTPDSYGSMLELTWRGTKPFKLPDGSERKFINDYDTVIMKGYCQNKNVRIGFGEVKNQVLPSFEYHYRKPS
jgi:fumarylacetoacetase